MIRAPVPLLLKLACALTLVSLGLIALAVLDPVPLAVIAAMSIAQALGTLGFLLFMVVVVRDLKPRLRDQPMVTKAELSTEGSDSSSPPTPPVSDRMVSAPPKH